MAAPLGGADARHGAADGLALAAAARRARRPRVRRLAHPRLLRLVRRRAGAADVGGRRRLAHLRDVAAASRADHADHRLGAARARARRRGHAPARGHRAAARDRPVPDRRVPLDRARLRARDDRHRVRVLLAHGPAAARVPRPDRAAVARREAGARRVRRACTATATIPGRSSSSPSSPRPRS